MKYTVLIIGLLTSATMQAQLYTDYIGAGHSEGITVSASSQSDGTSAMATIDGAGMDADLMAASRFLRQATIGFDSAMIVDVVDQGYESWVDDQMLQPQTYYEPLVNQIWYDDLQPLYASYGVDTNETFGPYSLHFNYAYWQTLFNPHTDYLRQRTAYAYSQIFVISENTELGGYGEYMANYYDMLGENAFGNFRDLIEDVTLHIDMGYYLSHLNNPKADSVNNIFPDENFARELMQLFTIGLHLLNNDGTPVLDVNGDLIPTYDNEDVKEAAKVFTGLMPGAVNKYVTWTNQPYFGLGIWGAEHRVPMTIDQMYHETSEKTILKGLVLPANQPGMTDIDMLLDTLFYHPNTGPFIARRLIQHMVKSNPTPAYLDRVATVFNDNGSGVRGDMGAVIKAILLDSEARDCAPQQDFAHGKMIEPWLRTTHALRMIGVYQDQNRYYCPGFDQLESFGQTPLGSTSVFNFFRPDYQPVGEIADNDLFGPEYQILNTTSAVTTLNKINEYTVSWIGNSNGYGIPWWDWERDEYGITQPESLAAKYRELTEDPDDFLDKANIEFFSGMLTDEYRNDMRAAMLGQTWDDYKRYRVNMGLYLMMQSPDFITFK